MGAPVAAIDIEDALKRVSFEPTWLVVRLGGRPMEASIRIL